MYRGIPLPRPTIPITPAIDKNVKNRLYKPYSSTVKNLAIAIRVKRAKTDANIVPIKRTTAPLPTFARERVTS